MSTTKEMFVRAAVPDVAAAFAAIIGGNVSSDVMASAGNPGDNSVILYRRVNSPWTVFSPYNVDHRELAASLSKTLACDVLSYESESVSGWEEAVLFRDCEAVEEFSWGLNYDEEFEDLAEELGEGMPSAEERYAKWDARADVEREHYTDQYLFRSALRTVDEQDLARGEAFVDDFFRHHKASRPSLDVGVWFDSQRGKVIAHGFDDAEVERADAVSVP